MQGKSGVRLRGGNSQFAAVIPSHFFVLKRCVFSVPSPSYALDVVRARCGDRDGHRRLQSLLAALIIEQYIEPLSLPEVSFADVNVFFSYGSFSCEITQLQGCR